MKILKITAVVILALLTASHASDSVSRGIPTTSVRCQLDTVKQISTVTTRHHRNDTVVMGFPLLTGSAEGSLWPNNATTRVGGGGKCIPTVSAGAYAKKGVRMVKEDLLSRIFMEMGLDLQVPDSEVFRGWGYECRGGVGAGLGDVLAVVGVLKGDGECGGEGRGCKVLGKAGSARVEVCSEFLSFSLGLG
jgi:hypothetical protein